MVDRSTPNTLEEKAGQLQHLLLNWLLPIASVVTLISIWIAVSRGWERGSIVNVVILICAFFIARSFYHFSKKQFSK